jgi:hypothetical protein
LPLVVGLLAAHGTAIFGSPVVEWVAVAISFAIGPVSLPPACRSRHRRKCCRALFLAGLFILITARLLLSDSRAGEAVAVRAGAALISIAHLPNRKLFQSRRTCQLSREPPAHKPKWVPQFLGTNRRIVRIRLQSGLQAISLRANPTLPEAGSLSVIGSMPACGRIGAVSYRLCPFITRRFAFF